MSLFDGAGVWVAGGGGGGTARGGLPPETQGNFSAEQGGPSVAGVPKEVPPCAQTDSVTCAVCRHLTL